VPTEIRHQTVYQCGLRAENELNYMKSRQIKPREIGKVKQLECNFTALQKAKANDDDNGRAKPQPDSRDNPEI
jgi:hypothetical protein